MIDPQGFRANIGIILSNSVGQLFWAKQVKRNAWQFPQGGMQDNEKPEETLFRELKEETGLGFEDVKILGRTNRWLRYRIPPHMVRQGTRCIGQKQLWYLLQLKAGEEKIQLNLMEKPEFDNWQWVSYWYPLREVIYFKREVYRKALLELSHAFFQNIQPAE